MSPRFLFIFFGLAHSFALLSKHLQSIVNEELMPSDLVKVKAVDPNWRGEGIFKRLTKVAGLFAHRETHEIILETKDKLWTESGIQAGFAYECEHDEFKNLIDTKDWRRLFLIGVRPDPFKKYWKGALAEIVDMNKYGDDDTVLMISVREDIEVVKILLERGADVSAENRIGLTALHHAALLDRVEAIELLLNFGADIDAIDCWGETPLISAVGESIVGAVEVLLRRGARSNMENKVSLSALDIARWMYHDSHSIEDKKIIKLLGSQQNKACLII